ncbi:MAG: FHA domain-containing protein [Pirellulales bacterium]|nr:FHA domain-containing protein [Pirellulales bacterium]
MEVKLIVVGGNHDGEKIPVAGPKFFVGRADDCQLRPQSDLVSRHHAVILVEDGFVAVRDFGSKNGTCVNGEKIHIEQELKNGDRLKFGPLEFEVELSVPVGGKKKPKVHSVQEAAARTVASAAGEDDEVDIFDLLGDEQGDPGGSTRVGDTRPMMSVPTAETTVGDTQVVPPEDPSKKKAEKDKAHGFAGRTQKAKKPSSADSRAAADDVLRQFFGRKS